MLTDISYYTTQDGFISNRRGSEPFTAPNYQNQIQSTVEFIVSSGLLISNNSVAIKRCMDDYGQFFRSIEQRKSHMGQHQSFDDLIAVAYLQRLCAYDIESFLRKHWGSYPTTNEGTFWQKFLARRLDFLAHLQIASGRKPFFLFGWVWAYVMKDQCKKSIKDEDGWRSTYFYEKAARRIGFGYRIDLCDRLRDARLALGGIGLIRGNHWGDHDHPLAQEER